MIRLHFLEFEFINQIEDSTGYIFFTKVESMGSERRLDIVVHKFDT